MILWRVDSRGDWSRAPMFAADGSVADVAHILLDSISPFEKKKREALSAARAVHE